MSSFKLVRCVSDNVAETLRQTGAVLSDRCKSKRFGFKIRSQAVVCHLQFSMLHYREASCCGWQVVGLWLSSGVGLVGFLKGEVVKVGLQHVVRLNF